MERRMIELGGEMMEKEDGRIRRWNDRKEDGRIRRWNDGKEDSEMMVELGEMMERRMVESINAVSQKNEGGVIGWWKT